VVISDFGTRTMTMTRGVAAALVGTMLLQVLVIPTRASALLTG
jgi:hypothetical protein